MFPYSRFFLLSLVLLSPFFFTACSSVEYTQETAPRMVVVTDGTQFYLHGPAQGNGEDRKLSEGDDVKVLRKEFGYSFVELSDGAKGYVANDALVTAPPEPSPAPEPKALLESKPSFEDTNIPEANTPIDPPGFRY